MKVFSAQTKVSNKFLVIISKGRMPSIYSPREREALSSVCIADDANSPNETQAWPLMTLVIKQTAPYSVCWLISRPQSMVTGYTGMLWDQG